MAGRVLGREVVDLIEGEELRRGPERELADLAEACADGPALAIGCPHLDDGTLYNAYAIIEGGQVAATILKHHLPNTEVFDEVRLFTSGPVSGPYRVGPLRIGSPICEDAWYEDVAEAQAESGAEELRCREGLAQDGEADDGGHGGAGQPEQ